MKVFVKSLNKEVTLPQNCVSGGEGDVYIKDGYAFKVYHEQKKALNESKFNELKVLDKENIIKPESLLLDNQGNIIGYMMKAVPKSYSLSRLVTNDFRSQHNIKNDTILKLIQKIRETFEFIHSKGCLIVDGNEMNYLVSEDFEEVYFIDVDSYQTPSAKANAYSTSTIDPIVEKTNKFTRESDWFIFGIISCTLLVGIHPFKGTYKGLSLNIKKGDVKSRMKEKRSVFNKNVSVNSAVRDFSLIPEHYKKWYINLFESESRTAAPSNIFDVKTFIHNAIKNTIFNGKVKTNLLYEYKKEILDFIQTESYSFIKADKEFFDLKSKKVYKVKDKNSLFMEINKKPYFVKVDKTLTFFDLSNDNVIQTQTLAESIFVIDNRLYSIHNNKINELKYSFDKVLIVNAWDIIENNCELFANMLVQRIASKNIVYIPFDTNSCAIINMKELEFKKVVNAYYANKMMELIVYDKGVYKRMIIKLKNNMKEYQVILEEETDNISINCVTLTNGVFISIFNDQELFMTFNNIEKTNINIIKDQNIEIDNKLKNNNNDVYMIIDNKICKISLT